MAFPSRDPIRSSWRSSVRRGRSEQSYRSILRDRRTLLVPGTDYSVQLHNFNLRIRSIELAAGSEIRRLDRSRSRLWMVGFLALDSARLGVVVQSGVHLESRVHVDAHRAHLAKWLILVEVRSRPP